jgi:nucleotidyltransferase AbiEii toxin of type IV toxin-antitoxin system
MAEPTGLSPEQVRALATLTGVRELSRFYLAGGTAVAVHLGHRRSVHLDLFSDQQDVDLGDVGAKLALLLGSAEVVAATDAALSLRQGDLAIDLVRYPYRPLDEPTPGPQGFPIAGLRDLAAMKLSAIAKRGIKRDFWDLHEIVTASPISLARAFDSYVEKFGVLQADLYHVMRSLTYCEDAEREHVFPLGLSAMHWERIKDYFRTATPLRVG